VITHSPFSTPVGQTPPLDWGRWEANKHLVFLQGQTADRIGRLMDPRAAAQEAIQVLNTAITLHGQIAAAGIQLSDSTNSYQANWLAALNDTMANAANDYDYLELMR